MPGTVLASRTPTSPVRLCQGCPTHPLWLILDVIASGSIHNLSGQGGLPAASYGLEAAPPSAVPPLGETSVPRAMQDFGISCVWSGTGTDTKEQLVLLGQAETGQRTLAKIRPQQSLKMGLREIVPHFLAFHSSWVGELDTQEQLEAGAGTVAPELGTQVILLPSVFHSFVSFYVKDYSAHTY